MLATVLAATLRGLEGRPVRVEVDVAPGLPGFTIVGLADAALRESRERVRGALRNARANTMAVTKAQSARPMGNS